MAGVLIAAEVIVTLAWQEPFSALSAKRAQNALSEQLAAQERAAAASRGAEMSVLAGRLERQTPSGDPLGRISIPKIGVDFVFVAGTGAGPLKKGPGHYRDTVLPGQRGSVGIAGHRTTHLAPFRKLDQLERGDPLVVKMPYGVFTYRTEGSLEVLPSNARSLRRVTHDRLVLTTCTPLFSAAKRLVVTGRLVSAKPIGAVRSHRGPAVRGPRVWRKLSYWPAAS